MSIATTQSSRTRPSPAALGYGAAVIALVTIPGYVQGQTRAGAIVSARSGISSSPYGNTGNGKSTLTVTIGVAPVVILEQETGTIALGGDINHTEYAKRYSSKTDYSTYLRTNHKLDGQTTLGTSFNYSNAKVTNSDGLNSATFVSDNPDLPAILDPSLANDVGSRRSNFQASASLSHQFSARQSVSLSTSASAVRYSSGSASSEYNFASVRGNYSHAVSEVLSLGAGVSASKSDYLRTPIGDTRSISPQLTARLKFEGGWNLSASGGAEFTRERRAAGYRNTTSASGSLSICNQQERWNSCLSAVRATLPSSSAGVGQQTSVSLSGSYRLDERSTLSASGGYSRSSRDVLAGTQKDEQANVGAQFSHQFSERLSGNVSSNYSHSSATLSNRSNNYSGTIGINYRFGNIK